MSKWIQRENLPMFKGYLDEDYYAFSIRVSREYKEENFDNMKSIVDICQKLGYTTEESTDKMEQLFQTIENGESIQDAIYQVFGELDDETYTKFVNAYSKAMGTGVLNMGQNIESLKNTINSFYEKAME